MEVKKWTYEEFPEFTDEVPGAEVLESTGEEVRVTYIPDVPYCSAGGERLVLQILQPSVRNDPQRSFPVVVYVQGSAWMRQDLYHDLPQISRLAGRGFLVAVVQYRGSDVAAFPAPIIDARNAVRFLKLHAAQYHGDPERIILMGCSSGGHTAVYAHLYEDDDALTNLFPGVSARVPGIIDLYGSVSVIFDDDNPMTLNHCLPRSPEGMEMGGVNLRERTDLRKKLTVECVVSEKTPPVPVLIAHGTKDRTVNTRQSVRLYQKLVSLHWPVQLVLVRGADHGGAEFWTEPMLDRMEGFIRGVLR